MSPRRSKRLCSITSTATRASNTTTPVAPICHRGRVYFSETPTVLGSDILPISTVKNGGENDGEDVRVVVHSSASAVPSPTDDSDTGGVVVEGG